MFAFILYSLGDLAIRFFRGDEHAMLGFLSLSQAVDLLQIPIAAYFLIVRWKTQGQRSGLAT